MEGETSREEEEAQAQVDIWKYVFGFVDMAVVKCAIELGIPDALEARRDSPTTLSDLSSSLGCSSSALHRIMRAELREHIRRFIIHTYGGRQPASLHKTNYGRYTSHNQPIAFEISGCHWEYMEDHVNRKQLKPTQFSGNISRLGLLKS